MNGAKIKEYVLITLIGAASYCLLEVLWRGYTHWSMALTGGVCFLAVYLLAQSRRHYLTKCLLGTAVITAIEFAVGVVVNIIFKLDVWDYSLSPMNLLGQICLLYSFFWFLLCLVAMPLCKKLKGPVSYLSSGIRG